MKKAVTILTFLFSALILFAQSDTTAVQATVENVDDADFAPGLFIFILLTMAALVAAFFLVAIVSVLGIVILMGLAAAGILSVSLGVGLYKRSFYSGFKWFVYLSCGACGTATVALIAFLIKIYWPKAIAFKSMLSWGLPAGFIGGLIGAWAILFLGRKVYEYVSARKGLPQN